MHLFGGGNCRSKEWEWEKERCKNGSKWRDNDKSNSCLSTTCKLSSKICIGSHCNLRPQETKYQQVQVLGSNLGQPRMIIGRPRSTREMQQNFFLLMQYLVYQRQPLHASIAQAMEISSVTNVEDKSLKPLTRGSQPCSWKENPWWQKGRRD